MPAEAVQRRKINRQRLNPTVSRPEVVRIEVKDRMGHSKFLTGDLIDASPYGIGITLKSPLELGSAVLLRGTLPGQPTNGALWADVIWCVEIPNATFRAGLVFKDSGPKKAEAPKADASPQPSEEPDHYEALQLSPNADAETIARVYRLMAQRYHPDNAETGNTQLFVAISHAHRVLSDPEQRARYDVHHRGAKRRSWKIFDQGRANDSIDEEKRKRQGVLALLYAKMLHNPETGFMTVFEFEELLGCPREHLQAALWYLRGKGFIERADNGRFAITVAGFDEAEQNQTQLREQSNALPRLAAVGQK